MDKEKKEALIKGEWNKLIEYSKSKKGHPFDRLRMMFGCIMLSNGSWNEVEGVLWKISIVKS